MTNERSNNLLLFSLFGIALWFFGNLYEGIVIAPNMLENPIRKTYDWQDFFVITNPIFFYIPIAPIAICILVFLYFKTTADEPVLKRYLKRATIFGLLSLVLGIFIITQINIKLFFGNIEKYSSEIYRMSVLWNILNTIRVVLLAVTLASIFRAYIRMQQKAYKAD